MQSDSIITKQHYPILDGLRGVAALIVVIYHIFEVHANNKFEQIVNHGYLGVDFFYLLSGFVIAYAYDDRWGKMTFKDFIKRRLIRLHPMVIMGTLIGALLYYFQASDVFPKIYTVSFSNFLLMTLLGIFLIPSLSFMNIRGWSSMFALNGTAWSLLYEYIANILYGLFIRKFSNLLLSIFVIAAGCFLIHLTLTTTSCDVSGGFTINAKHIHIAFARLLYPFFAGVLLFRISKLVRVKNAFLLCSVLLVLVLIMPRLGGRSHLWINGIYESFTIIVLFPIIVYLGACGEIIGHKTRQLCKFLGDISFPIYITHYPFVLLYWAHCKYTTFEVSLIFGILTFIISIIIAYACLKYYDEPIRKWLNLKYSK